ncbi:WXG100 family type VII secretion target [Streptomyces sp. NPDC048638]|uniref:WXG100 family type VII secretion target n=1 Tax=Streptomyces sp. NPDC048638 TaxID=3365580 RepID=UPI0037117868
MSGQQQEQQEQQSKIEKSFNLFNPGGDPSVLRACAEAWRHMAHDLKSTVETQDHEVTRPGDSWTGAAADAFHGHWKHTRNQAEKALPQFETVARQLDTTADAIQKANDEVHRVVEEVLATVAIGIGLSVLTAGFSDAIAAGAAEAEIAEATAEVTRLGQLLIRIAKTLETVKEAMADSKLLKFVIEFGKNTGANFIGNVGGQAVTGQKITWARTSRMPPWPGWRARGSRKARAGLGRRSASGRPILDSTLPKRHGRPAGPSRRDWRAKTCWAGWPRRAWPAREARLRRTARRCSSRGRTRTSSGTWCSVAAPAPLAVPRTMQGERPTTAAGRTVRPNVRGSPDGSRFPSTASSTAPATPPTLN